MNRAWTFALSFLAACTSAAPSVEPTMAPATEEPSTSVPPSIPNGECAYPSDPVRPMEVGQVLFPYSWPDARDLATGVQSALPLANVPCAADPDIDWSPFDVLLFVSIPAW